MEKGELNLRIRIAFVVLKVQMDFGIYEFESKLSSDSRTQVVSEAQFWAQLCPAGSRGAQFLSGGTETVPRIVPQTQL
jgi:hypothetical protein